MWSYMQGDYLIFAMCGPRSLYSSAHREPVNIPITYRKKFQSIFQSAKKVDIQLIYSENLRGTVNILIQYIVYTANSISNVYNTSGRVVLI